MEATGMKHIEVMELLREHREQRAFKRQNKSRKGGKQDICFVTAIAEVETERTSSISEEVKSLPSSSVVGLEPHSRNENSSADPFEAHEPPLLRMQRQLAELFPNGLGGSAATADEHFASVQDVRRRRKEQRNAEVKSYLASRRGAVEKPSSLLCQSVFVKQHDIQVARRAALKKLQNDLREKQRAVEEQNRKEKGEAANFAIKRRMYELKNPGKPLPLEWEQRTAHEDSKSGPQESDGPVDPVLM
jgi:hypothetical protein